jgi:hypothetical protein
MLLPPIEDLVDFLSVSDGLQNVQVRRRVYD